MKFSTIFVLFLFAAVSANAVEKQVTSPDGLLVVTVSVDNGIPAYSITLNGKQFLNHSPLGLKTNIGDFTRELSLKDTIAVRKIDESYELPNIKQSKVRYVANEAVFSLVKDNRPAFDVIFRVSNNDVAFKYKVYPRRASFSCVVDQEATGFVFPEGTTTFLTAQSKAMVGFARTMPSYEIPYKADAPMGENGQGNGYTFPCLFKVNGNGWALLSETGVDSRYCGSRLIGHAEGLYTIGFPMEEENNGNGTSAPGITTPGETPWRTITLGETLAPVVETTIPFSVVEPRYEASQKFQYGKGSWSWIMKMDGATVYDVQKEYIDFSAAMGYQTILVDALWDTQIGHEKIEELASYGKSKNVALFLWYNSNGYWNDAPQGPRGIMDSPITRRKEMAWMKSIGVRGIKVDFFGGDKQVTMKLYEDILYDANDFGLLVIFHGCTIPRGWERMYPNYAANTPNRGSKRLTSDVFALATAVMFQSAVQHFALAPNNLTDAPEWAISFMKEVPTTWDEVRFIDGYPGKYVVIARRHGDSWYVAGVNAQKETVKIKVSLPMFQGVKEVRLYSDDEQLNGKISSVKVGKKQEIELSIPQNGGVVIVN